MLKRFHAITIDANDVQLVARFWCKAAGFEMNDDANPYFATLQHNHPGTPNMNVAKVPEPNSTKNRMHIEFENPDLDQTRSRLESMGATFVAANEWHGTRWIVMQDPEQNEFCVLEHAEPDQTAQSEA